MSEQKQQEIIKLARKIKKLYMAYNPSDVKITQNKIQIFFDDDLLQLDYNQQTKKIGMKFQTVVSLTEDDLEPTPEPEAPMVDPV